MGDERDAQWLAAVGAGRPPGPFGHREHLRLAWLALEEAASTSAAQDRVSQVIQTIAGEMGVPQRYNRTVTDAWVRIVAHCRTVGGAPTFDDLLHEHPWLLDKRLLMRHYTSRTLASDEARRAWVEPDVLPIPAA
jgi:hypothetical protein